MKDTYAIQPYHVGSKDTKSLALVIPAEVVRQYDISPSTIFALRLDERTKKITLQNIHEILQEEQMTSAGKSFAAPSQQTSLSEVP